MTRSASCSTRSPNRSSPCTRYYVIRLIGGLLFLTGALLMVYNLIQTVRSPGTAAQRRGGCRPAWSVAGE